MNQTVSHHDYLIKHLKDPAEAAAYLNAVAEDGDIKFLLKALRNVVEAQGGVGELAKKTKLSRTTLYKTLSSEGNPEMSTLDAILAVYGIRIGFFPVVTEGTGRQRQSASIISKPVTRDYVQSLRGKYKGKGLMKSLMAEKKRA